ncbi:MAG: hypothetical protein EA342_18245 [Leptolyngbya sp. LCM1.Bin17]|nr:MAG: hypothetical protein EA342_18245 [Leptolyngbya sp. LCM1.Bin17]
MVAGLEQQRWTEKQQQNLASYRRFLRKDALLYLLPERDGNSCCIGATLLNMKDFCKVITLMFSLDRPLT